jgi:hypothetical protein
MENNPFSDGDSCSTTQEIPFLSEPERKLPNTQETAH